MSLCSPCVCACVCMCVCVCASRPVMCFDDVLMMQFLIPAGARLLCSDQTQASFNQSGFQSHLGFLSIQTNFCMLPFQTCRLLPPAVFSQNDRSCDHVSMESLSFLFSFILTSSKQEIQSRFESLSQSFEFSGIRSCRLITAPVCDLFNIFSP